MVTNYFGGLSFGGAEVQARETAQELSNLGVEVEFHTPFNQSIAYDIVHCFGPYVYFEDIVTRAKGTGVKVVFSTILWPPAVTRVLDIKRRIWYRIFPSLPMMRRLPESRVTALLRRADLLLPNSEAERGVLLALTGVSPDRVTVVPNGVEGRFASAAPELFRERFGNRDFVLNVANIGWQKNQLRLIRAVKTLGLPLVIIGRELELDYVRRCRADAGPTVEFMGSIEHTDPLLASAYAASRVFALPSLRETPGLAALEAALTGARIVVTSAGCAEEYLADHAWYCDPLREDDIAAKVQAAWRADLPGEIQARHVARFTWDRVARLTLEAYQRVLEA